METITLTQWAEMIAQLQGEEFAQVLQAVDCTMAQGCSRTPMAGNPDGPEFSDIYIED